MLDNCILAPMRKIMFLIVALICCSAQAVELKDLYSFNARVADNTPNTRAAILPQALDQLFLKLAGSHQILQHPKIVAAKQQADQYVRDFYYREASDSFHLTINFDENMVEQLLASADIPLLTKHRPVVMVWLVVGDHSNNNFVLIGEQAYAELARLVERTGQNYGIPTVMPLLDLTEELLVKPNDVAEFNEVPLQQAAGRYNVDIVLAGKITKQDDEWQCVWRLYAGDRKLDGATSGADLPVEIDNMFGKVTQELAKHYAGTKFKYRNNNLVFVRIRGVTDVGDYAKIMTYLVGLPSVKNAEVSAVNDQEMVVALTTDSGQQTIKAALDINTLLVDAGTTEEYLSYTLRSVALRQPGVDSD